MHQGCENIDSCQNSHPLSKHTNHHSPLGFSSSCVAKGEGGTFSWTIDSHQYSHPLHQRTNCRSLVGISSSHIAKDCTVLNHLLCTCPILLGMTALVLLYMSKTTQIWAVTCLRDWTNMRTKFLALLEPEAHGRWLQAYVPWSWGKYWCPQPIPVPASIVSAHINEKHFWGVTWKCSEVCSALSW